MAQIDFDTIMTTADGEPIPSGLTEEGVPAAPTTLRMVAMNALLTPFPEDAATPMMGYKLYTLANRVHAGGKLDLEAHDIQIIKDRIERTSPPWIVGRAWDALEGRDKPLDDVPAPAVTAAVGSAFRRGMGVRD